MLCIQQCIDLCDIDPRQAQALREHATLADIAAIQTACPRQPGADVFDAETARCVLLDVREQLLEELHAAQSFAALKLWLTRYRAYSLAAELVEGTSQVE